MATIKEIANIVNLPVTTVRRALRGGNKEVWDSARERGELVRRVAREVGYLPNASARATRLGRFGALGVISRSGVDGLQAPLNSGLQDGLKRQDLHMIYSEINESSFAESGVAPRLLRELCVDGLIVHYARNVPDSFRRLVADCDVPAVWLNTKGEHNCIYPDDEQGGRLAVDHLLGQGRRRIVFIRPPSRRFRPPGYAGVHYSVADREAGYSDAMRKSDMQPLAFDPGMFEDREPLQTLANWREWLQANRDVDGVITYRAQEGMCLLAAAFAEYADASERIPRVVSFHQHHDVGIPLLQPDLLLIPFPKVGRRAVELVCRMLETGESRIASEKVAYNKFFMNM